MTAPKPKALRTYLRLKSPAELKEVSRLFELVGLQRVFQIKISAGHSAIYTGGAGQIELYAPTPGSNWIGPPGDTDFLIRVTDTEAAYRKIKRLKLQIASDSKHPGTLIPPPGVSKKEMEKTRRQVIAAKRSFMVRAGGYNFFVC